MGSFIGGGHKLSRQEAPRTFLGPLWSFGEAQQGTGNSKIDNRRHRSQLSYSDGGLRWKKSARPHVLVGCVK